MQSSIRLDHLYGLMETRKLSKQDIAFIYNYLSVENRNRLTSLRKEDKIKAYKTGRRYQGILPKVTFTILNNPQMASELITALSREYKHTSFAILDADRLNPRLSTYLNSSPYVKSVYTHLDMNHQTGIHLLVDGLRRHQLTKTYLDHIGVKVDGYKNLHYFSGSYLIEDYEYFKLDEFSMIIEQLEKAYDVLVICVNQFIYDAFTCYALLKSHANIIGIDANSDSIKEINKYMKFLDLKQNIQMAKNYYLVFDYSKSQLPIELVKMKLDGYYLGNIPYDPKRHRASKKYPLSTYRNKQYSSLYIKYFKKIIRKLEL